MKIALHKRDVIGRKVNSLRRTNLIPASVYGPARSAQNVSVDEKEFNKVFQKAGYNSLIDIEVEGEGTGKGLIKEVQVNSIKRNPLHVSFYQVDMNKPITARIPVVISGLPPAVKFNIGILISPMDSVPVRCLPANLPHEITIDVSNFAQIGDSMKVGDLKLGEGVEVLSTVSPSQAIVFIAPPQKQIETETTDAAAAATPEAEAEAAKTAEPAKAAGKTVK